MMNKYMKILFFLSLLGLQSCKEEEIISYPTTYSNAPVTEYTIKAFTQNGEITDSLKLNHLIRMSGDLLTGMDKYNSEGDFVATYLSPEKVLINKSDSENTDTLDIHKIDDLIYWEKKDTISSFFRHSITFKYKPLYYEEIPIPISSGYPSIVKYKPCYYVKQDGQDLVLPMFDMIFYIGDSRTPIPGININNEFCVDSISYFGINDTLIVKEYNLILKQRIHKLK